METNILRIPRIKGLTNKARSNKHNPKKIEAFITSHYVSNGFTYLGEDLSIGALSELLYLNPLGLTIQISEEGSMFARLLSPESVEAANRSLTYLYDNVLTWVFKDRHQADELYARAKEQLTFPNGTIKTNMASLLVRILEQKGKTSQSLLSVVDSLRYVPSGGTNGPTILAPTSMGHGSDASTLTTEEAISLLQDMAQKALENPAIPASIYIEESIDMAPEVRARDAGSEGTKSLKASQYELIPDIIIEDLDL